MLLVLPVSTLVPEIPPDVLGSSMDMLDDWCLSSLSGCCGELKVKWTETDYSHNNGDEFKDDMCTMESRELKQPRRRRQQKPHKFAYLTMKNSSFARFARAFFIF